MIDVQPSNKSNGYGLFLCSPASISSNSVQYLSISITLAGMLTDSSDVQPANALPPIIATPSEMSADVSDEHLSNAP